jgi:S-formylglutathione hydrolase FrmB
MSESYDGGGRQPASLAAAGLEDGLTRRQVVIGGAAAAVALAAGGLWAGGYYPRIEQFVLRQAARFESGAVPPHSEAEITYATFASRVLVREVEYGIALPPGTSKGAPLPVCFCLPGRGGTAHGIMGPGLYLPDFVAQGIAHGVAPFALAAVDGGVSYWHPRAGGEDRLGMLFSEFVPLCEQRHHLGAHGKKRAVAGWSMGGYGALLAAETRPEVFAAVAAASPALWPSYSATLPGGSHAFDDASEFARYNVFAGAPHLAHMAVRVDCGTGDPFYYTDRDFVHLLQRTLPQRPAGGFSLGGHDSGFWRRVAPAQVRFLGRALA